MTVTASSEATSLISRFSEARNLTEALSAPLSAEDQTAQSMPDCSPTKWHRAHVTWFFETFVLGPHAPGYEPFDSSFAYLFNSYYEQVGERHPRPQRGLVTRPGAEEIGRYRASVDEQVVDLLARSDESELSVLGPLIELGVNHEQQHQELLLMDIKHLFSLNSLQPAYSNRPTSSAATAAQLPLRGWVEYEGGTIEVGADSGRFRFDNEGPVHQVYLEPFVAADQLVTCGEWLEFMKDGGYQRPELWLSDGWYTRIAQGWESPSYWNCIDDDKGWSIHTLNGSDSLRLEEPVSHVSFYEADAFATWAKSRLLTEFEWEHMAGKLEVTGNFLGSGLFHPGAASRTDSQPRQVFGDCWEWTGSAYRPYPRYKPPQGAIGEYNGKFMINTMVLRGGCALTPKGHVRTSYRNFYHPHTRWHLSGVRLAKN